MVQFKIQNTGADAPAAYRLQARFTLRTTPCVILAATAGETQETLVGSDSTVLFGSLAHDQSVTFTCGIDADSIRFGPRHIEMNTQRQWIKQ
jgi:hypothetical protein